MVDLDIRPSIVGAGSSLRSQRKVMATQRISGLETVTVGCVSPSLGGRNHHPIDKESQPEAGYHAFLSKGAITGSGLTRPVYILRDSGALQSLLRADVVT